MYFSKTTPYKQIQDWVTVQLPAVYQACKDGMDIEIKPHVKKRTNRQNRFFYVLLSQLVKFHHETGYVVPGLCSYVMQVEVLKTYWKGRYGVEKTHNMSAEDFGKLCDFVQRTLVEETNGMWEILDPESDYIKALIEQGC